jgi:hypothetical protein
MKTTGFEVCDEEAVNPVNRQRERRREERVTGSRLCARVRPGYRLVVIDLSVRGALVEAGRPLRPGSRVDVHLECDARRGMVAARVLRCSVAAIDSESGVTYRAALSFNEICEWVREAMPPRGSDLPDDAPGAGLTTAATEDAIPALQLAFGGAIAKGMK